MVSSDCNVQLCHNYHAELKLAAEQAEAEERDRAATEANPQDPAGQPQEAPEQPGHARKGPAHQTASQEGPVAPRATPKGATPRAAAGPHARFAESLALAGVAEEDRPGPGLGCRLCLCYVKDKVQQSRDMQALQHMMFSSRLPFRLLLRCLGLPS